MTKAANALVGELMMMDAQSRGVAAFVIDDDHVARAGQRNGLVDHQVVARARLDRDGAADDAGSAGMQRAQALHAVQAAHAIADLGRADLGEASQHLIGRGRLGQGKDTETDRTHGNGTRYVTEQACITRRRCAFLKTI